MICIKLSEDVKKDIEELHWKWFKNKILKNLISYLRDNDDFKEIFFEKNSFESWFDKKKRESVKKWFERNYKDDSKFEMFRNVILASPTELENYKDKFKKKKYNSDKLKKYIVSIYEDFRKCDEEGWSAPELIKRINVGVCPYCNRSYIDTYMIDEKEKKLKFNGQLDHFYSKESYPFLALSLYNMIPVCSKCNHIKSSEDLNINNPYLESENMFQNDVIFSIDLYSQIFDEIQKSDLFDLKVFYGNSSNFNIKLLNISANKEREEQIKSLNDVLHIESLYNLHKDYIRKLIKKAIIYNESRVNELFSQYKDLFTSKDEVYELIIGNSIIDSEISNVSLGKLTRDIWKELYKKTF